ncbi:MAG: DDE-type integrase/transposase/recombinase [Desulfobulbaceae bacterium]|nr:DDE-type integrase/transposase/recombinase [Desulfobulbaceae bacterium]
MTPIIKSTWDRLKEPQKPPHWTTVFRWKKNYLEAGKDITALTGEEYNKGNRKPRYPDEVINIVEQSIETIYLTRERKTIQDTLDNAKAAVIKENHLRPSSIYLPFPTRTLVKGMISQLPAFDKYAARHGRTAAIKKFRSVQSHRTTNAPLERAEIDHTILDLFVIDDRNGLPLGRPYVTACIDDYTRCLLGINIGFEPPSHLSVSRCLKHAFLPKIELNQVYPSINKKWNAHGVMRELVVDNGLEFHSQSLEKACFMLGIEIHYAPRKVPWFKGKIERFFNTFNKGIAHGNPGTTFRNIFEKDDYNPEKHAVVRLSILREIIYIWVVDYYHQKNHRALGLSPASMWDSSIHSEDIPLPDNPAIIDAIMGRKELRKLTHKGIELSGLLYNSPELTELRRKHGDSIDVEISVDDGDIGSIYVFAPDKQTTYMVRAISWDYAEGLTNWQHRVFKNYSKKNMEKQDINSWIMAKDTIFNIIRNESLLKKNKSNKKVARFTDTERLIDRPLTKSKEINSDIISSPAPEFTTYTLDQLSGKFKTFTPIQRQRISSYIQEDSDD